ncbi:hypothetical protein [Streptomyces sp. SID685]|nr:hypothetical protein [Streptomyces sp. SID685]
MNRLAEFPPWFLALALLAAGAAAGGTCAAIDCLIHTRHSRKEKP